MQVRALLLDAELRVTAEQAAAHPSRAEALDRFGAHGWVSPSGRMVAAPSVGAGGGKDAATSRRTDASSSSGAGSSSARCPRVAQAVSIAGSSSPTSRTVPVDSMDVLSRRRRLLAGASLEGGSVTLPDGIVLPGVLPDLKAVR